MKDNNCLTIFCQNIRSINRNLDSLMTLFNTTQLPDIIVLTETWHDNDSPLTVPGFVIYHTVRLGRSGGVTILVKNSISSCLIKEHSYANNTIEICSVKISNESNQIIVSGIYRPHSDSIENFTNSIDNILGANIFRNNSCALLGDFNIILLLNTNEILNFNEIMRSHHFLQTITDQLSLI